MTSSHLSALELRQLMQSFTRPVFNEMGRGLVPKAVSRAAELVGAAGMPLGAVLQLSYQRLRKSYRAEYIYKNEIASKVVFAKHSPRTASLVSELRVRDCILDLAVFNGTSTAYEIKTQYDSLTRLPEQLAEYLQVFDKVFVVTHLDGVEAALKSALPQAGVMALNGRGALTTVREAISNASSVDPVSVFRTLRQAEFLRILAKTHDWDGAGVPRGVLHAQALARFKQLSPKLAHELAVCEMRKRTSAPELVEFLGQLPVCLRTLGLSEQLSRVGKQRLLDLLTVCA